MERLQCDILIVGGGVIGLSAARALLGSSKRRPTRASSPLNLILVEREASLGHHASSRNSEVLHAGMYYAPHSQKASFCVRGRHLLKQYLEQSHIGFRECGKWIVASNREQLESLEGLHQRGIMNGVEGLELITANAAKKREPWLKVDGGVLVSHHTAIFDSHGLIKALTRDVKAQGGQICTQHELTHVEVKSSGGISALIKCQGEEIQVEAQQLVNATGYWTSQWASMLGGSLPKVQIRYALGRYWSLRGQSPTHRLIYPLPEDGGLGIHLTIDLHNRARFGPDVKWLSISSANELDMIDYSIDTNSFEHFKTAIQMYWPTLDPARIHPDYAGLRVKAYVDGRPLNDFVLLGPEQHGLEGVVHLMGIESPGLTSCLALGEWVSDTLTYVP